MNLAAADTRPLHLKLARAMALVAALALGCSCRSLPPLPPANLSAPGWTLRQGQAVWTPAKGKSDLAGELLVATNASGDFFVQFSKPPFTLATAQKSGDAWQIDFGSEKHRWAGRGTPSSRLVWFELPRVLGGEKPGRDWKFRWNGSERWRLQNWRTGESLEGVMFP